MKGAARTTYTYDNNGNLEVENASGTRTTYTWNDENQLTQVAKTGMTTNQYTFDGDGKRVQIVDSQGTKKPIWDFQNVLLETDGSNATQVIYTLEPGGYGNLVSQRRGSTTSFYLFDALGSTRKLTSSAGSVTDSYDFRAYGETFASSGSTVNVFRWVGELGYYLDIDRLAYYLRARPYNPAIARFLSRDPIGYAGSRWNLYEYANGNPVSSVDPSGLMVIALAQGRPLPCGGYTVLNFYQAPFKPGVNHITYIQRICIFAQGYTRDCVEKRIGKEEATCCIPGAYKRCTPCCYLEVIGGGFAQNGRFPVAQDRHALVPYSAPGCSSFGRYRVIAEVKAFAAAFRRIRKTWTCRTEKIELSGIGRPESGVLFRASAHSCVRINNSEVAGEDPTNSLPQAVRL